MKREPENLKDKLERVKQTRCYGKEGNIVMEKLINHKKKQEDNCYLRNIEDVEREKSQQKYTNGS